MKLKLDLHTHVWEAFNFKPPSLEIAEKVVLQIKAAGIDGIGITDHHNKDWSFEFRELVERHFPGEVMIIPGWEIEVRPEQNPFAEYQVAELFLPPMGGREGGVFRTYCHPGYYSPEIIIEQDVHAIEIDNYIHNWHIRKSPSEGKGQTPTACCSRRSATHTTWKTSACAIPNWTWDSFTSGPYILPGSSPDSCHAPI